MKNKILFISLALVLVASLAVGAIGCGGGGDVIPTEPTSLVIGMARDLDESLGIFDNLGAGLVIREFVYQVNNMSDGVYLSEYGTYKDLEIDRREISVASWDVGDITTEICADIKASNPTVHFLFGGPGTDCIYTQAPIANAQNVVLLTFEGGATGISNDPNKLALWPYVFISLSYSDWYQLPVLYDMLYDALGRVPKAYVVHIYGEHGEEYLAQTIAAGFDVVGDAEVPFVNTDMDADAVIAAAQAALNASMTNDDYDLFCGFVYPYHVTDLTSAIIAADFDPYAIIFGPGANFGYYAYSFGGPPPDPSLVEGIMSFTVAAYGAKSEIDAVYDAIAARIDDDVLDPDAGVPGVPPSVLPGALQLDYWGIPCYWAALEMWQAAVEDVGYVNQQGLRNALAALNMTTVMADNTWFRMYGLPGYGGGNLDYLCHTGEIGQWQSAAFETVGPVNAGVAVPGLPNYIVTGNFSSSMKGNWGWL